MTRFGGRKPFVFVEKDGQVRKSRGNPKNALVTIRKNGLIYFGIARCNFTANDTFDRKKGKMIAQKRAEKAKEIYVENIIFPKSDFILSESMMYGRCPVEKVKDLLAYFRKIGKRNYKKN